MIHLEMFSPQHQLRYLKLLVYIFFSLLLCDVFRSWVKSIGHGIVRVSFLYFLFILCTKKENNNFNHV
jgi:hypothetical protein